MIGRLWRASGGAALIEFALTAPVALLMAMGLCDLAYQLYMQSVLSGLVQKAGRDATIQNANTSTLDATVLTQMQAVNRNAVYAAGYPSRQSYAQFGYISPEPFIDGNRNGVRDSENASPTSTAMAHGMPIPASPAMAGPATRWSIPPPSPIRISSP
jgi:Flp pilus assembly protein TadG